MFSLLWCGTTYFFLFCSVLLFFCSIVLFRVMFFVLCACSPFSFSFSFFFLSSFTYVTPSYFVLCRSCCSLFLRWTARDGGENDARTQTDSVPSPTTPTGRDQHAACLSSPCDLRVFPVLTSCRDARSASLCRPASRLLAALFACAVRPGGRRPSCSSSCVARAHAVHRHVHIHDRQYVVDAAGDGPSSSARAPVFVGAYDVGKMRPSSKAAGKCKTGAMT